MTTFTREDFAHAARAAGKHSVEWADPGQINDKGGLVQYIGLGRVETWNPRDDDGDSFRLQVDLRLEVGCENRLSGMHYSWATPAKKTPDGELTGPVQTEKHSDHGGDARMATRHAIFRAAIAIGKAMPEPELLTKVLPAGQPIASAWKCHVCDNTVRGGKPNIGHCVGCSHLHKPTP